MIIVILAIEMFRRKNIKLSLLMLASYVFYYFDSGYLFVLLLFSSVLDFYCGKKIYESDEVKRRKLFLTFSIIGNLGILGFFKYTNFAIESINGLFELFGGVPQFNTLNIFLPVGISFFTFQTMSYTIDIYRRKLKPVKSFLKFGMFVAFFPQLVAGPIVRAAVFLPQLKNKVVITSKNLKMGLTFISWGLIKKIVFADNIAPYVNAIFADPVGLSSFVVILGAVGFGIQVYCDFSAYSDIATGCARIFGFKFPKNFNKPYFSRSVSEFWTRWHISLSTWFRDYVFTPILGKRISLPRMYFSIFVTFLLSGLWHGASWNFVIWGGLHGFFLVFSLITNKLRAGFVNFIGLSKFPKLHSRIRLIITQYLIFLSLLVFRAENFEHIVYTMKKFIFLDFLTNIPSILSYMLENKFFILLIIMFFYLHTASYKVKNVIERINSLELKYWFFYVVFVILLLFLFTPNLNTAFIYFQF
ncbi:MBOAT family protein [Candidatus Woesearchaeota archaeon]|nr:MBOAT family protein [Candidatus Woesearchaeota archaeon]